MSGMHITDRHSPTQRGKVLKNCSVHWKRPHEFCISRRPLGVSPRVCSQPKNQHLSGNRRLESEPSLVVSPKSTSDCNQTLPLKGPAPNS